MRPIYRDPCALEEQETAVQTARDALRVVEAWYRVSPVAYNKVCEAEAASAKMQANLYSLKCQRAALLAAWRYRTGRPVAGIYLSPRTGWCNGHGGGWLRQYCDPRGFTWAS